MESLHWFCFSYFDSVDVGFQQACTYTGYEHKKVTLQMIKKNKERAGVSQSAVLVSCSYLGFMTKEEFTVNQDEESKPDE